MSRKQGITRAARRMVAQGERAAADAVRTQARTSDSFQNFAARVGIGTDNLSSGSQYGFNPISRVRTLLEWMYRGSWIVGQAVDCIAEDMTKNGVEFQGEQDPDSNSRLQASLVRHQVWQRLQDTIKWARLYGGCIAVILIDGQNPATPLRLSTVGAKSFKGLLVLDRWMVEPSLEDLVTDPSSQDLGNPKFYRVSTQAPALPRMTVHHTRCIRLVGVELPYWQKISENLWGMSVLERIFDRLVAFDSGTQGAAQMMYKAYLRTLKIPQLRNIISAGGPAFEGLLQQVQLMRNMQSNEGMSIIDAEDDFDTHQYAFAGIADTLLQFGQQLSGALQIPLVRLFGQSPSGLNSTGESDLRTYYDGIKQRQEAMLRDPVDTVSRVIAQSEGIRLDPSFDFSFNPLWQIDDNEKAEIAERTTNTVLAGEGAGIVDLPTALKELKQQSTVTGLWTNITDEMIEAAKVAPDPGVDGILDGFLNPAAAGAAPPGSPVPAPGAAAGKAKPPVPGTGTEPGGAKPPPFARDAMPLIELHGLPIMIETGAGERRTGDGWVANMAADYGFIRRTGSAEGTDEGMDCFVGLDRQSRDVWVIDQCDPRTGVFDEHKVMLGFLSSREALDCYAQSYNDGGRGRVMGVTHMDVDGLKDWVAKGKFSEPLARRRLSRDLRAEPHLRVAK